MQSLGFYSHLLAPVSDHVFINRVSKEWAYHQIEILFIVRADSDIINPDYAQNKWTTFSTKTRIDMKVEKLEKYLEIINLFWLKCSPIWKTNLFENTNLYRINWRKHYFATIWCYFTTYTFIFTIGQHFDHMFDDFPVVSNYLPPPQARNTWSIFLCNNNNNRIRQSRIFQALRACQILSERCTIFHKVAHPSVSLPSCTGMSLKMRSHQRLQSRQLWRLRLR